MEGQTNRTFYGQLKVLESTNPYLMPVEVKALNSLVNRNNWQYINLQSHLSAFAQIPLLTAYNMGGAVIGGGHQFDEKTDPKTGERYVSFTAADAERIVGWVGDNSSRIENIDGVDWIVCRCAIWSWYAPELAKKIALQGSMEVSIETLVTKEHIEGDVAVEEEYIVLGITILGDGVQPAVAGASVRNLRMLSEMREAMQENILKAASYMDDESEVQEKNKNLKGEKALTYFSKKQCADLSKRFDGYTVLAAAQDENNVIHVALLSKNGDTAVYNMNSVDETIAVERIRSCNGTVAFDCGDNNCVNADLDCVLEGMNEVINEANENCKNAQAAEQKANESLTAAMATITEMRNAENARRIQSAKECAARTLSAYNASSDFEIPASALSEINADIDKGMYTERMNADGKWIGEDEVIMRVKSLCADEQKKVNDAKASKNNQTFVWEKLNDTEQDDGSVGALLKRIGVN